MSDLPERARRALRGHDAVAPVDGADDRYRLTTTPFDAVVDAAPADGRLRLDLTVRVPTLSAATTEDETVADVVEEGWYETFARRATSVGGGVLTGTEEPDVTVRQTTYEGTPVAEVTAELRDLDPNRAVADAVALVNYVEGTYVQGVVPGYEYGEPVSGLLSAARQVGGSDA